MSEARTQLLRAIRSEILGDPSLSAVITGVFDPPSRGAVHPFVTFGETTSRPIDGDRPPTVEHLVELWVYSRKPARREVSQIADAIRDLLDDAALTLSAHVLVDIRHRDTETAPMRDRRGFRARMRFRAITDSNT